MINKDIITQMIKHYGVDNESTVCMEKCAELIQAISKEKRGKHDIIYLAEKIADVEICLEMLKQMYGIADGFIDDWIYLKQKRAVECMGKGN